MTNETRLAKLKQAEDLIREVEFSYPVGNITRQRIYRVVVETFSHIGGLASVVTQLKLEIVAAQRATQHIETEGERKGTEHYKATDNGQEVDSD